MTATLGKPTRARPGDPPETKTCACGKEFTRDRARETPAKWARRESCSQSCGAKAGHALRGASGRKGATATAPAERPNWRQVGDVWRPNYPGWPDRPVIRTTTRSDAP